ncbi:hypothetical protein [Amycolatopsis sacchari]|uniref:hypothetical protein n=1 Tax=Amycolatopsis sacchari TaxID=115433 RepID=UPI003D70993A
MISWHRCQEHYRVDPYITETPVAVVEVDHTPEHDVVFAELGFCAASVAHEVTSAGAAPSTTGRARASRWSSSATASSTAAIELSRLPLPWNQRERRSGLDPVTRQRRRPRRFDRSFPLGYRSYRAGTPLRW